MQRENINQALAVCSVFKICWFWHSALLAERLHEFA